MIGGGVKKRQEVMTNALRLHHIKAVTNGFDQ